jgi:hypothetical protein
MLFIDGIHTLVNMVITNPTRANLVSHGDHNDGGLNKGRTLPQPTFDKCISSPCHKSSWLPPPKNR